jgi:hypothetical protein
MPFVAESFLLLWSFKQIFQHHKIQGFVYGVLHFRPCITCGSGTKVLAFIWILNTIYRIGFACQRMNDLAQFDASRRVGSPQASRCCRGICWFWELSFINRVTLP